MSDQMKIVYEAEELNRWLKKVEKSPTHLARATKGTAIEGLAWIKKELPNKSGKLRQSLLAHKKNDLSYLIWHGRQTSNGKLKYPDHWEAGTKAHTVRPKRAKMLTIPLRKSVITARTQMIKTAAKRNLFNLLKTIKPVGRAETAAVYDRAGIALALKARIPKKRGSWFYRDRGQPKLISIYKKHLTKQFKELGFSGNL